MFLSCIIRADLWGNFDNNSANVYPLLQKVTLYNVGRTNLIIAGEGKKYFFLVCKDNGSRNLHPAIKLTTMPTLLLERTEKKLQIIW
jgi:hypothetical protein